MTLYMVLFFLGFMIAVGLLAYCSIRVKELEEITDLLTKNLKERYSKPLTNLDESPPEESETKEEKT